MSKIKVILVLAGVFSNGVMAEPQNLADSLSWSQTESVELAKAVGIGVLSGAISGYFSAGDESNGIHLGNFFIEKTGRLGLNQACALKERYDFYSWAASWGGWTTIMLWKSTLRHTLGVGVPTMIGGFFVNANHMKRIDK